jgi:hypothetical protein
MVPGHGLSELAAKHLESLFELARPHLQPGQADEQNVFERMAILYRTMHRFPGDLRSRVKTFIAQYGSISDTPNDIAEFLEEILRAISLRLTGRSG